MIRLAWPHASLWPNSRTDRRGATSHRKAARTEGWAEAQSVKTLVLAEAHIIATFYPPDNRRRDCDNLLAAIKPHLDGIAAAAGVDDAGWMFTVMKGEPVKNGAVVLEFRGKGAWQQIGEVARQMIEGTVK